MSENAHLITTHRITPDAFAAWLHAQGQEPSVHVLAWFKARGVAWPLVTDTSAVVSLPGIIEPLRPCIEPLPGWAPNSKFGLQRSGQRDEDRLVRVEDVASWLSDRLPRDHVVKELFAPLMHEEGQAASRLFVLRGGDFAVPLLLGDRPNVEADSFWRKLPFTRADTRPEDVIRDVADAWAQAWPGHGQDPDVFYREGWVSHCKRMKSLAQAAEGPHGWEEAYSDRYYISLEDWRHQCKDLMHSLGHLGVPFSAAHELWGWGAIASEPEAASVVPEPAQIGEADVIDMQTLAQYRGQFSALPAQQRPQWPAAHVEIARAAANALDRGGVGQIATQLGMSRQGLADLFKRHPIPKASPFPAVRRS